jgi:hypothetical protein
VKRTSRLGAQVVRISADLLHFHSTPSASESSTGGVDLIGAKVDAQASAKNAAMMTKGRFIAVLPISGACRLAVFFFEPLFDQGELVSGVGFSLSSGAGKTASSNGQIVSWEPGRRNLFTGSRPAIGAANRRVLDSLAPRQEWWRPFTGNASFAIGIAIGRMSFKPN